MPRNVLVIEDDKDIARLLDLHLKDEGYSVTVVSDGKTGLAQALSKPYDIVILGGAARSIKNNPFYDLPADSVPDELEEGFVLMLTAN